MQSENTKRGNNNNHYERLSLKSKKTDSSFLFDLPDSGLWLFRMSTDSNYFVKYFKMYQGFIFWQIVHCCYQRLIIILEMFNNLVIDRFVTSI